MKLFTPDRLKVASRDLTNLPLLEVMAETRIPIILSTGMAGKKELTMLWRLSPVITTIYPYCIAYRSIPLSPIT